MRKIFNVYGDKLQNFAHNKQTIFLHKVKIYVYHSCTLRLLLYVDGEKRYKKFNLRHFLYVLRVALINYVKHSFPKCKKKMWKILKKNQNGIKFKFYI